MNIYPNISTPQQIHFPSENTDTVQSSNPNDHPICGELIGAGSTAEVFKDVNDPTLLLKKYDLIGIPYDEVLDMAKQESTLFNAFYGDDASIVIQHDGNLYLRMLKVPGVPLSELDTVDIPENLEELYLQLICKLNELKIIHYDLNTSNMLYDKETNSLFPIDFRNAYNDYYSANTDGRRVIDKRLQNRVDNFYEFLDRKNP
ncbi:protein kinase [Providencia alcalifaciens]|uniref:OspG family effector kinase n=1 Tax=Providencia alcalifaciens TaxID=126385 RepID=UPI0003E20324|nr:protein kinase [Providencia alcalifaciens]ETT02448.1 hypothetical protein HMPREF1568_0005 [Providencia alcalifaciens PAL-3]ETT06432.1 hypothetical protein HMPREF1562_0770 [Providencia alcalifaciens F90-2004]EUC93918.1 hypothetical protein HMPREF1567_0554 [Providencia alcalifaciens PAL-2]EUD01361.1 hypothetical protein HMPREF1566_2595 [Providencia alcalifaciens PAL-1]